MTKTKEPRPYNPNRDNGIAEVLARLEQQPEIAAHSKVVGRWIWIEFDTKPADHIREWLSAEGFYWNRKRSAWQHCCGIHTARAKGYDPREKYQSAAVTDVLQSLSASRSKPEAFTD
jgi:hypothetical protein